MSNKYQEIQNLQSQIKKAQASFQCTCDHKNDRGKTLEAFNQNQNTITGNQGIWSSNAVRCTQCGAIFEAGLYEQVELQQAIVVLHSAIHQIKMLANLDEEMSKRMVDAALALQEVESMTKYYVGMRKRLGKKKDNNQKKNRRSSYGIGADSFNTRRY